MLNVNSFVFQSLSWAANRGHGRVVRILLEHGADPKIYSNDGQVPSDLAYSSEHHRVSNQKFFHEICLKIPFFKPIITIRCRMMTPCLTHTQKCLTFIRLQICFL